MSLTTASKGAPPNGWVGPSEAADILGVDVATLEYMRTVRRAPTWALLRGTMPIYRRKDVEEWAGVRREPDR